MLRGLRELAGKAEAKGLGFFMLKVVVVGRHADNGGQGMSAAGHRACQTLEQRGSTARGAGEGGRMSTRGC
jgi:hypothetical protein